MLGQAIAATVGPVPVLALTATATPEAITVIREVAQNELETETIRAPMLRKNLQLKVERKADTSMQDGQLMWAVRATAKPCLIFLNTRNRCVRKAEEISTEFPGYNVECFHAGMHNAQKNRVLRQAVQQRVDVLCCTVAFGMGVNILIKSVIHWDVPQDIEAYVQAVGRAGRDGSLARCTVFWNKFDFASLHDRARSHGGQVDQRVVKIEQVQAYCGLKTCRNKYLAQHFEAVDAFTHCGCCDVCHEADSA